MNTPRRRAFAENLPIHFQPFVNRRMRKVLSSFHSQHDKEDDHHVTKVNYTCSFYLVSSYHLQILSNLNFVLDPFPWMS